MLKKKSHILLYLIALLTLGGFIGTRVMAAARTASVSGNWSNTATWGGAAVPVAGDNIILNSGITLTVDVNTAAVTTIVMNAPAANNAIIINSGITLNATGAITMTSPSAGTITQTLAVGDGILNAASIAIPGSATAGRYCTMSINTGTVNVTGAITTSGTAAQSRITFTGAGTINVGGNFASGTFTPFTGTVNFNGTGAQTIGDLAYNNLTTSGGSGTKTWTLGAGRVVGGIITVGSGTNLTTAGNQTLGVTGATNVTGTLTLGGTSGKTFTGDVTIYAGGVWNETGVATYTIAGNFTNNATTFTANTGVHTFSGAGMTIGGTTANVIPSATFTGNYTNGGTLTCSTALTVTGAAVVLTNNGTMTATTALSGTGTLTNAATFTLNIGGTCSITTLTNAGTTAIAGTGAISTALANFTNIGTLNLGGSGAITGITNGTGGIVNLTNSGTITSFNNSTATSILNISDLTIPTITTLTVSAAGNTVNYSGAGAQTVIDVAYSNLTTSGSGIKTWTEGAARNMTGNLTVGDGTTLSVAGAFAFTVTGTTTIGNGTSGTLSITNATGTKTFTGAVTINAGGAITESAAVNLTFGSDVTINGTGTLTESGAAVVSFAGNFTNNGTYTASSGNHTFSGANKTIGGTTNPTAIPTVIFSGTYTNSCAYLQDLTSLTVNGTLTNNTTIGIVNLAGSGALIQGTNANLSIGGSSTITTLTATAAGNTVSYFIGGQTVFPTNYYNLTLSGSGVNTLQAGTTTISGNLTLSGTATTTTVASLAIGGNLNIGNGTTFTSNAAYALTVSGTTTVGGGISGTLAISTAATNTQTFTGAVTINNGGVMTESVAAPLSFGSDITDNGTLNFGPGTLNISGNLSGTGTVTGGSGFINISGNWTQSGTFTASTSTVNYNGSFVDQIVRGGITYYNLQISNGNTKLLQVGNATVSNVLTLNSGVFKIGDYNLILTNTGTGAIAGSPFSISSMIQTNGTGYVQKAGAANGVGINIVYPVGSGGYYNPLDLTGGFTVTGVTTGNLQVTAITASQGPNALSKYWMLAVNGYAGLITSNLRFTYDNAEVHGSKSQYDTWYNGGSWISAPGIHTALGANPFGTNVSGITAAAFSGKWTAGSTLPSTSISYYSYQSGDWAAATSWTTDPSGTLWINSGVPAASDNVSILNGRTITVNSNNKIVAALTINQGGILDIQSYTGHNFGIVTGQGKMMLSSNNLPGGTYTGFVASNGGTVEYYNLSGVGLSTSQLIYNNLIISNYINSASSSYLDNTTSPTYTINGNFSLKNYSSGTNTFSFGNPTASDNLINMNVYGNFSVDAGCNILVNNFLTAHTIPNPTATPLPTYPVHTLSLYGNFTNNGSVRFTGLPSPVANGYYMLATTASGGINYGDVQVFFKGAINNTVACNGTTDFFRFIVEKGADNTYTLEVSSTNTNNFALYAPNNQGNGFDGVPEGYGFGAYYKALFIHYGTLKLDANINIPSLTEGGQDFNIIPTAELWINGATVSTTVSGVNGTGYQAATLYGSLRVSAGSFSTGDAAGIVLGTLGTPVITVEGTGTLDVSQAWTSTGGSNQMSYIQTGGTANFRLQGENHAGPMLSLSNVNSVFVMSGGVVNFTSNTFSDATTDYQIMDIESQTGAFQVTGGTINLNLPSSATSYTANSTVPLYNLNVSNQTGTGTVAVQWNTPGSTLNVLNDLTIGNNSLLNLNTSSIDLTVGRNFTISSGGTYSPGISVANTTTFNGTGAQAFNNIGTITTGALNNLTITNSSVTSIISNNLTVNGTLSINTNAILNDSGKTITVGGNINNSGTHATYQTTGGIVLNGTAAQTLSGNGTGIYKNLTLNKAGGSVTMTANMAVTGNLRLAGTTAGVWNVLNIGVYSLSLGANTNVYSDMAGGTAFNNNRMIQTSGLSSDGGVSKSFPNTNAFNFPFGFYNAANATYYYMPQSIQFSSAPTAYGTVTTRPVNARHPLVQTANSLACYWKTTSTGFTGIPVGSVITNYYYDYALSKHFVSGTETNYIPAVYLGSTAWNTINNVALVNEVSNQVSYNTADSAGGEYTAGETAAFSSIPILYSIASGNWNSPSTWSTTRTGSAGSTTPTATTLVYVCNGKTVTTTAAASSSSLSIEPGATLDLQNISGHNFGTIINTTGIGSGTVRIASSAYFPTGDWANFLGSSGGTVEYYQTAAGTLALPTTYTLPGGGAANITGYYNLITSPYNGSNIILPNTNLSVYNNFTVGYSTGGGTANCITQINAAAASTTFEVHGNININQYGIFQYMNAAAENVIADNDIAIAAGGTMQVRNGGTSVANSLTVYGNIINNGTFDLDPNYPTNDSYYCNLMFTGSFSKALTSSATPTRTRLYNIGVSKGTSRDSILNVNIDPTLFQLGGGGLNLQNGTFRLTTNVTMNLSTGAFTIPATSCLSVNGGTFNIATGTTAAADLTLNGRLEILGGSINIGPAITSTSTYSYNIVYATAGTPEINISGGTLNVFSQIRRPSAVTSGSLNYTQTGGTVTIGAKNSSATRAALEVLNTGSKFVMNNGTIVIANHISNTAPYDLDIEPDISNVMGGTIQFGLSGVTANQTLFYFQSSSPIGNLTLDATTNAAAIQEINDLTLIGNLTVGGASSYYNTNGLDLTIGGNLTNNNTTVVSNGLTIGGFQTQVLTQTTTFNGSADQTITGTGTPNRTNFANVEVLTAQGHNLFLSNATPTNLTVNGDLTLTSGTFNDGGNSIYLLNDVNNNAVHVSPNAATGGMVFAGTVNQGITGSGSGVFGNIEINNSGHGVNMTDNSTINGQLKFTNGDLYIDDYALTLGQSASIVGTFNVLNSILLNGVLSDRGVTKIFATGASSFAFPISANGKYTPCSYNFASNSNSSGATIKVVPVDSRQPSVPDTTSNYLAYYWSVSTTGFSAAYNVTHTYTYIPTDVEGTAQYIQRYDNSTGQWSTVTGTISSPTFTFASTTLLDGSYTIGNQFASLATITSIKSGNWNDATVWNTSTVPNGNPVVIRSVDSIALNSNGANAASVVINGVLDALNSTFHNLGQVSGSGKIRLSSTSSGMFAFPGGTYDAFLTNPASTVEFYGTINGTLPLDPGNATKPYQNVIFSGTGIKYISSIDMKINGNLIFSNGSKLDNTLYNKDVYLLGNWIDNNTATAGFSAGTGTIHFTGTTAQNIIMANNSMTEPFYNFAVNNTAGLTLQTGKVAINNQLVLTTGNINTNSTNTLTIANTSNTGVVVGGGVNSFVNGPLNKQINNGSNFQFPVGDAVSSGRNRIGYVSVTNTSTSGTQTWTVQFFDKNPSSDGYDITKVSSPLSSVVQNEYWNVIGPTGGSANVVLNWDSSTGMNSSAVKRALSRVAEWNTPASSSWNSVGAVVADNGQYSGTVATSTLVGIDNHIFTIGATSASLITAIQSGLWNNSSTWGGGGVPSLNDTVRIGNTITITLNTNAAIAKLIIDSGGTFNNSSNTLSLSGNLIFNGNWTGSGGKISMTTSPDTIFGSGTMTAGSTLEIAGIKVIDASASPTLATVSILANDTIYNNGTVTINNLSGAVFVNNPGATFYFTGADLNSVTLLAPTCTNTIEYSGTVSQIVKPMIYCGLNFSNSGIKTLSASATANGIVNVKAGATLTITGDVSTTFTIHGDFNNDGTVNAGGQIVNQ
jgi:hypothetical protein